MSVKLKGMTWSHPRGYDPLVACSALYKQQTGVEIEWDKRSLQDFESFPVEELARTYDLVVIDHPHVGQITAENCLTPLDIDGRETAFDTLAAGSVGESFRSYNWQGRQWAFPIDAATQAQAYREDLVDPIESWEEVLEVAEQGGVLLPLRPPHSLMTFYTLCANLMVPCASSDGMLVDPEIGAGVFDMIAELVDLIDPACFDMDPIAVLEKMAEEDSVIACSPYIYGYVSYAVEGFRKNVLTFADIPETGMIGPAGSALGGTGIAVSSFSKARDAAVDFAYWIASADIQKGLYASSGGQPGHAAAWEDEKVNEATGDFYANTRMTLEGAWVRPRHNGYMAFQQAASERINAGLKARESGVAVVADLNRMFAESFG
ncbi:carbohydrate ABC transporter substrate-binding protein [Rhizobium sp. KVB221]|uniref:Carbohydrate ABC transporter substrate-binding protein n=1 Tax=Rhizobium setariae TaxID=2801340 RepID=A0A936YMX1_9HYPH|nr:ABC transporter substrate-binding protein [Rhizobium setariae]MBL0372438.1 carbohydrate ABC transporter substrate-binding protein [Rhizobium setariae]